MCPWSLVHKDKGIRVDEYSFRWPSINGNGTLEQASRTQINFKGLYNKAYIVFRKGGRNIKVGQRSLAKALGCLINLGRHS